MFAAANAPFDAVEKLAALWCGLAHNSVHWPIHGQYQCRKCGRHYQVTWAEPETAILTQRRQPDFEPTRAVSPIRPTSL